MRIVTVRRISQVFFLVVFLWFCVTATLGANWWQLRGWPINWILDLDPLTSLATVLATGTLYADPHLVPGRHRADPGGGPVFLRLCLSPGRHQPGHRLGGAAGA